MKYLAHPTSHQGLLFSIFTFYLLASVTAANADPYRLNAGDQLHISVWGEENLQSDVTILPDGSISFPLVGILTVAGKSLLTVTKQIEKKLQPFVPDATVTITVLQTSGNVIYIVGKVNNPGTYPLHRQIDVLQALSLAGGLDRFAKEDEIRILRRINGKALSIPFDYSRILRGENLETNILLQSGDTIVVP